MNRFQPLSSLPDTAVLRTPTGAIDHDSVAHQARALRAVTLSALFAALAGRTRTGLVARRRGTCSNPC